MRFELSTFFSGPVTAIAHLHEQGKAPLILLSSVRKRMRSRSLLARNEQNQRGAWRILVWYTTVCSGLNETASPFTATGLVEEESCVPMPALCGVCPRAHALPLLPQGVTPA